MVSVGKIGIETPPSKNKIKFEGYSYHGNAGKSNLDSFNRSKDIQDEITKLFPKFLRSLKKMNKFTGETSNIIINAIGTGLVAPIFIKHNFLSKTDEDTRTYSALRQPVSAVLAIATQAGMLIPINKLINSMSNSGYFADSRFQKNGFEDLEYIKKQLKKANPTMSKAELNEAAKEKYNKNIERLINKVKNADSFDSIKFARGKKGINLEAKEVQEILNRITEEAAKGVKENTPEHKIIQELKIAISEKKSLKEIINLSKKLPESNFAMKFVEQHVSNVKANLKGYNQIVGLMVSLAIMPLTCSLLNHVYPKFVEKFFPELSKSKADNKKTEKELTKTEIKDDIDDDDMEVDDAD